MVTTLSSLLCSDSAESLQCMHQAIYSTFDPANSVALRDLTKHTINIVAGNGTSCTK
jgi:hypothetical protein